MAGFKMNGTGHDELLDELTEFIKATDEAIAAPRPDGIDKFYVEQEYAEAEREQREAYAERGEVEARPAEAKAHGRTHEADLAEEVSHDTHAQAKAARGRYDQAVKVLGALVRRPTNAKFLYWFRGSWILGGDTVGVAGAALLLGEQVLFAVLQAMSASISAITLGAVGRELRYLVAARARQKDREELTEDEKQFAAFFAGPNNGEQLLKIIVLTCAAGTILIAGAILALRTAGQGPLAGAVFGCLALALGLASMYNSYDCADDVAEFLDNKLADEERREKKAREARRDPVIGERAAARFEAGSAREANQKAGEAAAAGLRRRLFWVLGNSPGVAGNGTVRAPSDDR